MILVFTDRVIKGMINHYYPSFFIAPAVDDLSMYSVKFRDVSGIGQKIKKIISGYSTLQKFRISKIKFETRYPAL